MKTIKIALYCTAALLLFTLPGCIDDFTIEGNGIEATEGRAVGTFSKLKSSGSFDVHITGGDRCEVVVSAESNIIPYIETYVSGNTLVLNLRGLHNFRNRLPMEVFVTTPAMESILLSGSGNITTGRLSAPEFETGISGSGTITTDVVARKVTAAISGSGNLNISGTASASGFFISGSGKISANHLRLEDCDATISGSGNMVVNVSESLHAHITGSGNIYYYGAPGIESRISGSGRIIQIR